MIERLAIGRTSEMTHDVVTGHVRIDDMDVSFVEVADKARKDCKVWAYGADDGGLRYLVKQGSTTGRKPAIVNALDEDIPPILRRDMEVATPPNANSLHMAAASLREDSGIVSLGDLVRQSTLGVRAAEDGIPLDESLARSFSPVVARIGPERMWLGTRSSANTADTSPLTMPLERARYACEVLAAYPWLRAFLLKDLDVLAERDAAAVNRSLLTKRGLSDATIRRLSPEIGILGYDEAALLLCIPHDWMPARGDGREWAALRSVAKMARQAKVEKEDLLAFVSPSKGKWVDYLNRAARMADLDGEALLNGWMDRIAKEKAGFANFHVLRMDAPNQAMNHAMKDALDMSLSLSTTIGHVATDTPTFLVEKLAWEMIVGKRGIPKLLETSRKWHREQPCSITRDRERIEWPALLPSWTCPATGIEVVVPTDSHALADEGMRGIDPNGMAGMGHCVGDESYALRCARGAIRILSLRKEGHRVSTAEIDLAKLVAGDATRCVSQHRGRGNAAAGADANAALKAYLLLPEVTGISQVSMSDRRSPAIARSFEQAYEAWRPYLTGWWRTASASEARERIDRYPGT